VAVAVAGAVALAVSGAVAVAGVMAVLKTTKEQTK